MSERACSLHILCVSDSRYSIDIVVYLKNTERDRERERERKREKKKEIVKET